MEHKLVLVQQTKKLTDWECPVCQRLVRMNAKGGGIEILNPGDQRVNHGSASTTPGLKLSPATIETPTFH
jgi:hypothetical protein